VKAIQCVVSPESCILLYTNTSSGLGGVEAAHDERCIATFRETSDKRPTEVDQRSEENSKSYAETKSDFPNSYIRWRPTCGIAEVFGEGPK